MSSKIQTLFDPNQFLARKKADQAEFEVLFEEEMAIFHEIFHRAFDEMLAERRQRGPSRIARNWEAVTMNSNAKGYLIENFGHLMGKEYGTYVLFLKGYKIYFKKLYSNFLPQFKDTRHSKLILHNRTMMDSDDIDPVIFVGYQTDDFWSRLQGCYVVATKNTKKPEWVTPLESKAINLFSMPENDIVKTAPIDPEVTLKSKGESKAK